jgi:hypothetical protein
MLRKTQIKNNRLNIIILSVSLIIFLIAISTSFAYSYFFKTKTLNPIAKVRQSSSLSLASLSSSSVAENQVEVDIMAIEIRKKLKQAYNIDMGFPYTDYTLKLNHKLPLLTERTKVLNQSAAIQTTFPVNQKRLTEILPKPTAVEKTNWLSFEKYGVEAPVIYSSYQDMFELNADGSVNFSKPIIEKEEEIRAGNYESVPIQKLLKEGVVHLSYSTYPGEVGNSYIVGHSSNFSSVKSDYNTVFKPLESKTQVGDEFFIYDIEGRKLKFRVFEAMSILAEDTATSYKFFGDKRVVTLQASIVELVKLPNGKQEYQANKRWITRGELVLE